MHMKWENPSLEITKAHSKHPGILPISVENEYPSESRVCSTLFLNYNAKLLKLKSFMNTTVIIITWVLFQIDF